MKSMLQKLLKDEAGVVLSSEIVLVGTVGVLGMVVGLEAVTSSVNNELNDFASAIGAVDQSYNYRGIWKPGHAWASGSGYNDRGDYCDCVVLASVEVVGKVDSGGTCAGRSQGSVSESGSGSTGPVVRDNVVEERVINETIVAPQTLAPPAPARSEEVITDERIIRRGGHSHDEKSLKTVPETKDHKRHNPR